MGNGQRLQALYLSIIYLTKTKSIETKFQYYIYFKACSMNSFLNRILGGREWARGISISLEVVISCSFPSCLKDNYFLILHIPVYVHTCT